MNDTLRGGVFGCYHYGFYQIFLLLICILICSFRFRFHPYKINDKALFSLTGLVFNQENQKINSLGSNGVRWIWKPIGCCHSSVDCEF